MILTERLELIPVTLDLCLAESQGHDALARLLGARIPSSWPPPVYQTDDRDRLRQQLERDPYPGLWTLHYVVSRRTDGDRDLVGVAGYGGPPTSGGEVFIGYAVAEEHQRRGYASEAVHALVAGALADPAVQVVVATTYPSLEPSIKVLLKTSFVQVSQEQDGGIIRFERRR